MRYTQDVEGGNESAPAVVLTDPLRLAALGTATYLSYWTLFFAVCRACGGRPSAKAS